jgi:membrane protease YdiL (CAAX protease family)
MAPEIAPSDPLIEPSGIVPHPPAQSTAEKIFLGPNGIRAGWRVLIFVAILTAVIVGLIAIPFVRHHLGPLQPKGRTMTPAGAIFAELVNVLPVLIAGWIMTKIEKRCFADYGLPPNQAFGKLFWQGLPVGFLALSVLMGLIIALHGFSLGGLALHTPTALKYGFIWGIAFLLTGLFEELLFRGYLQSVLTSGMGFWPAAILLAILFGASHLNNPGEAKFGAASAGAFGLVMAFSLWRTGTIWFAIGLHAAWDWGETFFYSVPDSGLTAQGHLFNSWFHGPQWLTGGSVGPEGSLLVFPVLLLMAVIIHVMFPARRTAS